MQAMRHNQAAIRPRLLIPRMVNGEAEGHVPGSILCTLPSPFFTLPFPCLCRLPGSRPWALPAPHSGARSGRAAVLPTPDWLRGR